MAGLKGDSELLTKAERRNERRRRRAAFICCASVGVVTALILGIFFATYTDETTSQVTVSTPSAPTEKGVTLNDCGFYLDDIGNYTYQGLDCSDCTKASDQLLYFYGCDHVCEAWTITPETTAMDPELASCSDAGTVIIPPANTTGICPVGLYATHANTGCVQQPGDDLVIFKEACFFCGEGAPSLDLCIELCEARSDCIGYVANPLDPDQCFGITTALENICTRTTSTDDSVYCRKIPSTVECFAEEVTEQEATDLCAGLGAHLAPVTSEVQVLRIQNTEACPAGTGCWVLPDDVACLYVEEGDSNLNPSVDCNVPRGYCCETTTNAPTLSPTISPTPEIYFVIPNETDFFTANELCQERGAELVSIHSPEEQLLVWELCLSFLKEGDDDCGCWNGFNILGKPVTLNAADFVWTDGTPNDYNNFEVYPLPQPNNLDNRTEQCVQMRPFTYGGWNDLPCTGNCDARDTKPYPLCKHVTPSPTVSPTENPTNLPTVSPTENPTNLPTLSPTNSPTFSPTETPTHSPTSSPTETPTYSPTRTPSDAPTRSPTKNPTNLPTYSPTKSPTHSPTKTPTQSPTNSPTTSPTKAPTKAPTESPTKSPTKTPTESPTKSPTKTPTTTPTLTPTNSPTDSPTHSPTLSPTKTPSTSPSETPTKSPSHTPTKSPTRSPSTTPTTSPTEVPSITPTFSPTKSPTFGPSESPTSSPSVSPSVSPTKSPTVSPTNAPTISPTSSPTVSPSHSPTISPSNSPTISPTHSPTFQPSVEPTWSPTKSPTKSPTHSPTKSPTNSPTKSPTKTPTNSPTKTPTTSPTRSPSSSPTQLPTLSPTKSPTHSPTKSPTEKPTHAPTKSPTKSPTHSPTHFPTKSPTHSPTTSPTPSPNVHPECKFKNGEGVWKACNHKKNTCEFNYYFPRSDEINYVYDNYYCPYCKTSDTYCYGKNNDIEKDGCKYIAGVGDHIFWWYTGQCYSCDGKPAEYCGGDEDHHSRRMQSSSSLLAALTGSSKSMFNEKEGRDLHTTQTAYPTQFPTAYPGQGSTPAPTSKCVYDPTVCEDNQVPKSNETCKCLDATYFVEDFEGYHLGKQILTDPFFAATSSWNVLSNSGGATSVYIRDKNSFSSFNGAKANTCASPNGRCLDLVGGIYHDAFSYDLEEEDGLGFPFYKHPDFRQHQDRQCTINFKLAGSRRCGTNQFSNANRAKASGKCLGFYSQSINTKNDFTVKVYNENGYLTDSKTFTIPFNQEYLNFSYTADVVDSDTEAYLAFVSEGNLVSQTFASRTGGSTGLSTLEAVGNMLDDVEIVCCCLEEFDHYIFKHVFSAQGQTGGGKKCPDDRSKPHSISGKPPNYEAYISDTVTATEQVYSMGIGGQSIYRFESGFYDELYIYKETWMKCTSSYYGESCTPNDLHEDAMVEVSADGITFVQISPSVNANGWYDPATSSSYSRRLLKTSPNIPFYSDHLSNRELHGDISFDDFNDPDGSHGEPDNEDYGDGEYFQYGLQYTCSKRDSYHGSSYYYQKRVKATKIRLPFNNECYKYIRITDKSTPKTDADDGFDIHAIKAKSLCCNKLDNDHLYVVNDTSSGGISVSEAKVISQPLAKAAAPMFVFAAIGIVALAALVVIQVRTKMAEDAEDASEVEETKDVDQYKLTPSNEELEVEADDAISPVEKPLNVSNKDRSYLGLGIKRPSISAGQLSL